MKIFFTFTNSVDPDEMQHYAAFIWVLTVSNITCLRVSRIQEVKELAKNISENIFCLSGLLHIHVFANGFDLFKYRGKQCGPRTDCSYRNV